MFGWNRITKKQPTIKPGFLVPTHGGPLLAGKLYIYDNGVCIVRNGLNEYEATYNTITNYTLNSSMYSYFLVTVVE